MRGKVGVLTSDFFMLYISGGACHLRVGVIGINYKSADLELHEALARGAQNLSGEKALFFRHAIIPLSTCNRTEFYFSAEDLAEVHSDLLAFLRATVDLPFEHRLYSYFGIDCLAHLCRVASGLNSAILAETEIQRQVKVAYEKGAFSASLPSALHYLFQKALKVGKTVRNQLELERGSPSLYGTLWQIAGEKQKGKRILLVGYSEINRGFAAFLARKGKQDVSFITSHPSLIRRERERIYGREQLQKWSDYDLIVAASKADEYLIEGRSENEHLIFDLSVPRNVDPDVGRSSSIELFNIEQINQRIEQGRKSHRECLEKGEGLVWENALRLARIYRQKTLAKSPLSISRS